MTYQAAAKKALSKLQPSIARRITAAIDALADNPRPQRAKKLVGQDDWLDSGR